MQCAWQSVNYSVVYIRSIFHCQAHNVAAAFCSFAQHFPAQDIQVRCEALRWHLHTAYLA
jgi:hypothetical protein